MRPYPHILFFLCVFWLSCQHTYGIEPITDIPSVRALSRGEAQKAVPVKLSGVVVWRGVQNFVLHDGKAGIWVDFRRAKNAGFWKNGYPNARLWSPSCAVTLEGHTEAGGFAPIVVVSGFQAHGEAPMPDPRVVSVERLLSGAEDAQYVEIEGVVRKHTKATPASKNSNGFFLMVSGHPCPVSFHYSGHLKDNAYVDARVKVRGILAPLSDLRAQVAGLKLHANGPEDITIVTPAPPDPFQVQKVDLNCLIPFAPDADLYHRKLASGTVTYVVPGRLFYLWDGKNSVRVADTSTAVTPGDRVDVAGFIDTSRIPVSFSDAVVRITGKGTVPSSVAVTADAVLHPIRRYPWEIVTEADADGQLVRMTGLLRRILPPDNNGNMTLVVEFDEKLVRVLLPATAEQVGPLLKRWVVGSTLEISAACELNITRTDTAPWFSIQGFHLWLAAPEDVRVLHTPSWWTPKRLAMALGLAALVVVWLLVWSAALRRQVEKQTHIILEKNRTEATTAERARIARDLHDEIGANLTHISILSTLAAKPDTDPAVARRHTLEAAAAARQTILAFDETLWSISPKNDTLLSLCHYICRCAEETFAHTNLSLRLHLDENVPDYFLPPHTRHALLLAVKESLHNVLKHAAGATRVDVGCQMLESSACSVCVEDNGIGWNPENETDVTNNTTHKRRGHGLSNMRRRMEEIGGSCQIVSQPGKGTRVVFHLPLDHLSKNPITSTL